MFKLIRDFLKISYHENHRMAGLLIGSTVLLGTYLFAFQLVKSPPQKEQELLAWLDSVEIEPLPPPRYEPPPPPKVKSQKQTIFFRFNPNTADSLTLLKLSFRPWLISRILKFRSKGGYFYLKSDLKKIYNFPLSFYERLENYIDLPTVFKKFDLNTADSLDLRYIKGIGKALSKRILKYRTLLGGYYRSEQLAEVYGLAEDVRQKLSAQSYIDQSKIKKIDLNQADYKILRAHPYIDGRQAKIIIEYRQQHGTYKQATDLLAIKIVDQKWLERLKPYLSLE